VNPYIQKFSNKFSSSGEASDIYNGIYWLSMTKGSIVAALLAALRLSTMIYAEVAGTNFTLLQEAHAQVNINIHISGSLLPPTVYVLY